MEEISEDQVSSWGDLRSQSAEAFKGCQRKISKAKQNSRRDRCRPEGYVASFEADRTATPTYHVSQCFDRGQDYSDRREHDIARIPHLQGNFSKVDGARGANPAGRRYPDETPNPTKRRISQFFHHPYYNEELQP